MFFGVSVIVLDVEDVCATEAQNTVSVSGWDARLFFSVRHEAAASTSLRMLHKRIKFSLAEERAVKRSL